MPIIGTTSGVSSSGVYPTVADVIAAVQQDFVNQIGSNHPALIDYTNRVELDLLRHSRWKFYESTPVQFTTTIGVYKYFLGSGTLPSGATDSGLALTNLGIIDADSMVNRTSGYTLSKSDSQPVDNTYTQQAPPLRWVIRANNVLELYPYPDNVYTIEFEYFPTRNKLTATSDSLSIPEMYFDVVVAGVNELAAMYLAKDNPPYRLDMQYWGSRYREGKAQMVRDANLFPRGDFIAPDNG